MSRMNFKTGLHQLRVILMILQVPYSFELLTCEMTIKYYMMQCSVVYFVFLPYLDEG